MKIAIANIFYNSVAELERLIDSIPPNCIDYFIGIDGIFRYTKEQNPQLPDISNDGSRELLMQYGGGHKYVVCLQSMANGTEFEKRNTYLKLCEKLQDIDVIIIVDTDEHFIYSPGLDPVKAWQRFRKNIELEMIQHPHHNVYGIPYLQGDSPSDTYKPRIWCNPSKMRYINGSHYHYANVETEQKDIELFKQNRLNYLQQARSIIKGGVILTHDQDLRSKEYQQRREEYQRYLVKFEELTQSHKYTLEECHKLAKENPKKDFIPT